MCIMERNKYKVYKQQRNSAENWKQNTILYKMGCTSYQLGSVFFDFIFRFVYSILLQSSTKHAPKKYMQTNKNMQKNEIL